MISPISTLNSLNIKKKKTTTWCWKSKSWLGTGIKMWQG